MLGQKNGSCHPCMVYIPIHLVDVYGLHVGFHIRTSPMDPMGSVVLKLSWFCSFPFFSSLACW